MESEKLYWHIASVDAQGTPRLGNGDGREIRLGETLTVEGTPKLCETGLHFCEKLIDCLDYASGSVICQVRVGGRIVVDGNKGAAQERTVVRWTDVVAGEKILREFARWCALQIAHMWNTPEIVRQYLETGDESIRDAAWAAARAAAWDTARDTAWAAARDAARAAAGDAAWDAAWDTARDTAWDAAGDAAWAAAWAAAGDAAWAAAWDTARDTARAAARAAAGDAAWDTQNNKLVELFEAHAKG